MKETEKKKTKAELRREFNDLVCETVLKSILKIAKGTQKTHEIKTQYKMSQRRIYIKRYNQDITINILANGEIFLELREFCHSDFRERIFVYTEDKEVQNEFIESLERFMMNLMSTYLDKEDFNFHSYMDYVVFGDIPLFEVYDVMKKDFSEEEIE